MISSINWCWFKYACTAIQYCFHYKMFTLPGKDSSPWAIPHTYYWTPYVLPDITKGLASLLGWLPHATTETLQAEAPVPYQYSSSGPQPDRLVTCCLPSPTSSIARQAHVPLGSNDTETHGRQAGSSRRECLSTGTFLLLILHWNSKSVLAPGRKGR